MFVGDAGDFFGGDDHLGGFVGDEGFALGQSWGGDCAGESLLGHGGGGTDGLLDGSLSLLHGSEVGDVNELGAAIGDNGHGYGDCGCGI